MSHVVNENNGLHEVVGTRCAHARSRFDRQACCSCDVGRATNKQVAVRITGANVDYSVTQ